MRFLKSATPYSNLSTETVERVVVMGFLIGNNWLNVLIFVKIFCSKSGGDHNIIK